MAYVLAPSVYGADYMDLKNQLQIIEAEGIRQLHIDIMDGRFVPNLSFGPGFLAQTRACTPLLLDVHMMVMEPGRLIGDFAAAGADRITVHLEACGEPAKIMEQIRSYGVEAGLALKPETGPECLAGELKKLVDVIQVMTVQPGLAGQTFLPESIEKIKEIKAWISSAGREIRLEADGDIRLDNLPAVLEAGADTIVVGKGLFTGNLRENLRAYLEMMTGEERTYGICNRN